MPTKSLFLQVDGNIDPLRAAMKAGKSVLAEFSGAANDTAEEVQKAFAKLGGGDIEVNAKRMEASMSATFQRIRANAQAAASSGNGADVLKILGLADAEQAAAAAETQVTAFRMLADGAHQAAAAKAQDTTATESEIAAARALAVALEADFLVAQQHAGALRTQASALGGVRDQLGIAAGAHKDLEGKTTSNRIAQMEMMHVVRASADSFAAGTPPMQIFAMEMGRVAEAASMMGPGEGVLGKVAAFMSGGWGIAIMIGVAALTSLISAEKGAGDAADKQKEAENALANVIKRLTDETKGLNDNELVGIQRHIDRARAAIAAAQAERQLTKAILEQALASQNKARDAAVESGEGGAAIGVMQATDADARRQIDKAEKDKKISPADAEKLRGMVGSAAELKKQLDEVNRDIEAGGKALEESLIKLGVTLGTARTDRSATRNFQFEQDQIRLDQQARREHWSVEQTAAATKKLTEARDADLKKIAEEERKHRERKGPGVGSEVDEERGKNLFAVAQRYAGLSETRDKSKLEALFAKAGIPLDPEKVKWCAAFVQAVLAVDGLPHSKNLSARSFLQYGEKTEKPVKGDIVVLSQNGQDHVGFYDSEDRKKKTVRILAGNTGNKVAYENVPMRSVLGFRRAPDGAHQLQADEQEANRRRAFEAELAQADAAYAKALIALSDTADDRYKEEVDQLRIALAHKRVEIGDQVKAGKIEEADAAILLGKYEETEFLQEIKLKTQERQHLLDEQLSRDRAQLDDQISMLHLEDDLATTRKERLRIALQLLAAEEKEARAAANRDLKSDNQDTRLRGQQALDKLDREHPLKVAAINQRHADPVTAYMEQIKANAGDMNEALKNVEADGLKNLEDGLVGILSGTESVASAFKKMASSIIADLARIAIEKAILGGLGKLFGGGGLSSFKVGDGDLPMAATGYIPGFAAGGTRIGNMIRGPGTGTSDSILALLGTKQPIKISNGESIMTAEATRENAPWLKAMNEGLRLPAFASGRVPDDIRLPALPGARSLYRPADREVVYVQIDKSELFDAHVQRAAAPLAQAAAVAGAAGGSADALSTLSRNAARRLPTMSRG